jgi:alkylation response protein AidB-like acyl-CoA dehydrogenase
MADEAWAPIERYVRGPLAQAWVDKVASLARDFAERAALHDREGSLPTENVAALRAVGYPSLTVPATAGGAGAGLYDLCLLQEILATGDGATALGVGWHLSLMLGLAASGA